MKPRVSLATLGVDGLGRAPRLYPDGHLREIAWNPAWKEALT